MFRAYIEVHLIPELLQMSPSVGLPEAVTTEVQVPSSSTGFIA